MPEPLEELASEFRREAELLRSWGANEATAAEHAAERVERALRTWQAEELTVVQAAAESGYSAAHLRRLLAECRLENAGSQGRPRIRRADLPRKPNRLSADDVDLVSEVLTAREVNGL